MSANRNARLAVVCILLTAVTTCSRRHEEQEFLPSAPPTQSALQVTNVGNISLPADGASTVRIEAQISPDANVSRLVRFHTTLGGWAETAAAGLKLGGPRLTGARRAELPQTVDKEADSAGRAAAFLQSATTEGTAVVTVSVISKDDAGNVTNTFATVTRDVSFVRVTDAIALRVDPEEAFGDGESEVRLEAEISADSPASWNMVVFSTTLGRLGGTEAAPVTTVTAATDADRVARAVLVSDELGTATVSAQIEEFAEATVTRLVSFIAAPSPDISTAPQSLDFGEVTVNATSDQVLSIGNHGTVPLTVTGWAPDPAGAGFSVPIAPTLPATVSPSSSIQITVRFNPTAVGAASAVLGITSDDQVKPEIGVTLAGVGVAAAPSISTPSSLAFGDVTAGTDSDKPFKISNNGSANLTIEDVTFSNAEFSLFDAPTFPETIAPGGSLQLTVRFSPVGLGAESGVMTIESNDPLDPDTKVSVTGTGI